MLRSSEGLRKLTAVAIAAGAIWAVEALGRAEVGREPQDGAIRLTLRSSQARIEICRDRSAEELAKLPAHMRTQRVCDDVAIDYRLSLDVDGRREFGEVLSHSGLRRTRPLVAKSSSSTSPSGSRPC